MNTRAIRAMMVFVFQPDCCGVVLLESILPVPRHPGRGRQGRTALSVVGFSRGLKDGIPVVDSWLCDLIVEKQIAMMAAAVTNSGNVRQLEHCHYLGNWRFHRWNLCLSF